MSGYSLFLEMAEVSQDLQFAEIVVIFEGEEFTRVVEIFHHGDDRDLWGELWCDMMDFPTVMDYVSESDELIGEIRVGGKVVHKMRKIGTTCS